MANSRPAMKIDVMRPSSPDGLYFARAEGYSGFGKGDTVAEALVEFLSRHFKELGIVVEHVDEDGRAAFEKKIETQ